MKKQIILLASFGMLFSLASCSSSFEGADKVVKQNLVEGTVSKVEIVSMPTKVSYDEGEYFDDAGMKLKAVFSSGTSYIIPREQYSYPVAKLTKDITSVPVTFKDVVTDIAITVHGFEAKNSYKFEAESDVRIGDPLDYSGGSPKTIYQVREDANASGGKYISNLSDRVYTLTLRFDASEAKKSAIYLGLGLSSAIADLTADYQIFLNGAMKTIEEGEAEANAAFHDVLLAKLDVQAGENVLVISRSKRGGNGGNLDYVKIDSDATLTKKAFTESKIECEPVNNANATYTTSNSQYADETARNPSGGHAVGGCNSGATTNLKVNLNATKAGKYSFYIRQGLQPNALRTTNYTVKINNEVFTTTGAYADKTATGDYVDWCEIYWGEIPLKEGANAIEIDKASSPDGCNMDYLTFLGEGAVS